MPGDETDRVGVIVKINFEHLGLDPDNYLAKIRRWKGWHTPTPIQEKFGRPDWKMLLYDPKKKAITAEFDIESTKQVMRSDYPDWCWCHNITRRSFKEHGVRLARIEKFFPKFGKGPNPYWYVTGHQYTQLIRDLRGEFFDWLIAFDEEWLDAFSPQMLKKLVGRILK
jgi:hypothetical protein